MKMGPASIGTSASFYQDFEENRKIAIGNNKKIYIAYKIFRNGEILCNNTKVYLGNNNTSNQLEGSLCGDFLDSSGNTAANWTIQSMILTTNITNDSQRINFLVDTFKANPRIHDLSGLYIGIKDIMVVDVTNLYKDGTTDAQMKAYLDKNLPYMQENYPLAKY